MWWEGSRPFLAKLDAKGDVPARRRFQASPPRRLCSPRTLCPSASIVKLPKVRRTQFTEHAGAFGDDAHISLSCCMTDAGHLAHILSCKPPSWTRSRSAPVSLDQPRYLLLSYSPLSTLNVHPPDSFPARLASRLLFRSGSSLTPANYFPATRYRQSGLGALFE